MNRVKKNFVLYMNMYLNERIALLSLNISRDY